jgi:hypothetical protein
VTPELLRQVGEALYGDGWQAQLSREADIAERTIRRWLSGAMVIPAGVVESLYAVVVERRDAYEGLAREIEAVRASPQSEEATNG